MQSMKSCEHMEDNLARLVQGECNPLETKELQSHMTSCPACRQYFEGLKSDDLLLREFAKSHNPAIAQIRNQVMDRLSKIDLSANSLDPSVRDRSWVRYAVAAGLMAATILTVGVLFYDNQPQEPIVDVIFPDSTQKDIPKPVAYGTPEPTGNLANMEPLPIKLPVAMYRDTPRSLRGVGNLEEPRGVDRPPFYAPKGAINVALGKPVKLSDESPILGEAKMVTDGEKNAMEGCFVEMGPFAQFATIDLQGEFEIYAIVFWHYHLSARSYKDVVVQVSMDQEFTNAVTLFNNDSDNTLGLGAGNDKQYVDTNEGRLVDAKGLRGRFVRLYSNGNNENELNHLIEVEVWGRPWIGVEQAK
jgi:hypothetical protein